MAYDAFISHASEDKSSFVLPLAEGLRKLGVIVWFDGFTLRVGDSLSRSIDKGLAESKFGIVVLSKAFLAKRWTEYELRGLTSKEIAGEKVILPIWHGITHGELLQFSPSLADKYALDTRGLSFDDILLRVTEVIRPDIYQNLLRLRAYQLLQLRGKKRLVATKELRSGPIRHESLSAGTLVRIEIIHLVFRSVFPGTLEDVVDSFRRDMHPEPELQVWERMAAVYLSFTDKRHRLIAARRELLEAILLVSMQIDPVARKSEFKILTAKDLSSVKNRYRRVAKGHFPQLIISHVDASS